MITQKFADGEEVIYWGRVCTIHNYVNGNYNVSVPYLPGEADEDEEGLDGMLVLGVFEGNLTAIDLTTTPNKEDGK